MEQAQGQMEQSAARVPGIISVASIALLVVVIVIIFGTAAVGHRSGEKGNETGR